MLQIQLNQIIVPLSNSSAVSSQVCRIPPNNSLCFELYNETDFHQQISDVFLIVFFSYGPIPCLLVSLSFEGACIVQGSPLHLSLVTNAAVFQGTVETVSGSK